MKLFVAGCSVSDYTKVSRVYGEILAEKLGHEVFAGWLYDHINKFNLKG